MSPSARSRTRRRHEPVRRRLAALARLAELSGGRATVTALERRGPAWRLTLASEQGGAAFTLRSVRGAREAHALLALGPALLADVRRDEGGLRLRLAIPGDVVDVWAEDWRLVPAAR